MQQVCRAAFLADKVRVCGGPLGHLRQHLDLQINLELLNLLRFSSYPQQRQYTSDIDDISIIVSTFPSSIHRH
jgi:hypothetical protein